MLYFDNCTLMSCPALIFFNRQQYIKYKSCAVLYYSIASCKVSLVTSRVACKDAYKIKVHLHEIQLR